MRGQSERAEELLHQALERSYDPHSRIFIRSNLAVIAAIRSRRDEAISLLRGLLGDADATGDLFYQDTVRYNLASALLASGQADESLQIATACPPHHVTSDDSLVAGKRARLVARILTALGREVDAGLRESMAVLDRTTKPQAWLYRYEWELADIEFWED
jgi:Flp pilus assembly protein TadD